MLPEVIIPLVSASVSSVFGAMTLMITQLSKQRTERIKHTQDNELERERLRFISAAYEQAAAHGQALDLVDLALALHGNHVSRQPPRRRRFTRAAGPGVGPRSVLPKPCDVGPPGVGRETREDPEAGTAGLSAGQNSVQF